MALDIASVADDYFAVLRLFRNYAAMVTTSQEFGDVLKVALEWMAVDVVSQLLFHTDNPHMNLNTDMRGWIRGRAADFWRDEASGSR